MKQSKHDEAISILEKGKDIITDRSLREPIRALLAINYCDRGIARINENDDHDGGKRDLERALDYDPDNSRVKESISTIYANEGFEYFEKNNTKRTIKSYEKALKYNPQNTNVKENLAFVYNHQAVESANSDRIYEARDYIEKAFELDPYNETIRKNYNEINSYYR